jgi:hypothetical protein
MPELVIRDSGGVARTISELVIRDGTNTPRTITELRIRDANNVSRLVFNPGSSAELSVGISDTYLTANASFGQNFATSSSVTLTISGGVTPYSVQWHVAYFTGPTQPYPDTPTGTSTTFTQTNLPSSSSYTGFFYAVVTDSNTPPAALASDSLQIDFYGWNA